MSLFEYTNYREYLLGQLGPTGSRTGMRKKLAESIPVHTSFISQVLQGQAEFSLEQAEAINSFLGHSEEEAEYFLLLLMLERAGSHKLKERWLSKVNRIRTQRLEIQKRIKGHQSLSDEDRERFYSNAYYGAIHVMCSLPHINSSEDLAQALKLPRPKVQSMVDFLLQLGLVVEKEGRLQVGPQHIHLGADSSLVLRHHINWRQKTIQSLQFQEPEDLHYSAALSLSQADAFAIKEALLEQLSAHLKRVASSPEEVAYVLTFDFFRLA